MRICRSSAERDFAEFFAFRVFSLDISADCLYNLNACGSQNGKPQASFRGVAKLGIALGSGPRGPGFESRRSDHFGKSPQLLRLRAFLCFQVSNTLFNVKVRTRFVKEISQSVSVLFDKTLKKSLTKKRQSVFTCPPVRTSVHLAPQSPGLCPPVLSPQSTIACRAGIC